MSVCGCNYLMNTRTHTYPTNTPTKRNHHHPTNTQVASLLWAPSSQALFLGLTFQYTTTPGVVEVNAHVSVHTCT